MAYQTIVLTFPDYTSGDNALAVLQQLDLRGIIDLDEAAVIKVDANGKASVKDTEDVGAGEGALIGALYGGLIGLIAGPAGVAIGTVAGAATGGTTAALLDFGFSKDEINDLKQKLGPNTSAIIAIIEQEWLYRLEDALDGFTYNIYQQALDAAHQAKVDAKKAKVKSQVQNLFTDAEKSWKETVDKAQAEINTLSAKVQEMSGQMKTAATQDRAKMQSQISELQTKLNTARQNMEQKIREQLQKWDAELAQKRAEVASAVGAAKVKAQTEVATLNIKREEAAENLRANLEAELNDLDREIHEMEAVLNSAADSITEGYKAELARAQAEREATRQQLEQLKVSTKNAAQDLREGLNTARQDVQTGFKAAHTDLNTARQNAQGEYHHTR
jgi:uncharacterized membrane protein